MKTVREYIDEINDCKRIADELEEAYEWASDSVNHYPYDAFLLDVASDKLKAYIEMLNDMPVGKGGK